MKQIKTYIAEALSSERGTKFGKKGDQKGGKEVKISECRDFGFTKVYRFKNAKAGILCAKKAIKIAESKIGSKRTSRFLYRNADFKPLLTISKHNDKPIYKNDGFITLVLKH